MSTLVFSSISNVILPDLKFCDVNKNYQLIVPILAFHNHDAFDPLSYFDLNVVRSEIIQLASASFVSTPSIVTGRDR